MPKSRRILEGSALDNTGRTVAGSIPLFRTTFWFSKLGRFLRRLRGFRLCEAEFRLSIVFGVPRKPFHVRAFHRSTELTRVGAGCPCWRVTGTI